MAKNTLYTKDVLKEELRKLSESNDCQKRELSLNLRKGIVIFLCGDINSFIGAKNLQPKEKQLLINKVFNLDIKSFESYRRGDNSDRPIRDDKLLDFINGFCQILDKFKEQKNLRGCLEILLSECKNENNISDYLSEPNKRNSSETQECDTNEASSKNSSTMFKSNGLIITTIVGLFAAIAFTNSEFDLPIAPDIVSHTLDVKLAPSYNPKLSWRLLKDSDHSSPTLNINTYEISNSEYKDFTVSYPEYKKSWFVNGLHDGEYLKHWPNNDEVLDGQANHPVVYISWFAAKAFCEHQGGRLPSPAEWISAAGKLPIKGMQRDPLHDYIGKEKRANFNFCEINCIRNKTGNSDVANLDYDDGYAETAPVNSYSEFASLIGAVQLWGNVMEWTEDINGEASKAEVYGGSFNHTIAEIVSAKPTSFNKTLTSNDIGFRCVKYIPKITKGN